MNKDAYNLHASPGKEGREIAHRKLTELLSWSGNGFSPGFHVQPHLGTMSPWMYILFSYDVSSLFFTIESRLLALKFWIHGARGKFPVIAHSTNFFVSSKWEVNHDCLSIILAKLDTCSPDWLAS